MAEQAPTALIAALQKATVGSREIDADILRSLAPDVKIALYCIGDEEPICFHGEPFVENRGEVPTYTTSIDAALALVPDGWNRRLSESDNHNWWVELREGFETSYNRVIHAEARTAPLALCIAALKARLA